MEKIRKLVERIWYNKERIVFAILVVILGWNVYRALNPSDTDNPKVYRFPKHDISDRPDVEMPPPPNPPLGYPPVPPVKGPVPRSESRQKGRWKTRSGRRPVHKRSEPEVRDQ